MAYAIVQTGGKQYRVAEGDLIDVEKLDVAAGNDTTLDVLFIADGGKVQLGSPLLAGASVTAEVIDQHKGEKVIAYKFKRRKGFHKTKGFRRHLTKLEITAIGL